MNKNIYSVRQALKQGFKIGFGLSGRSKDKKKRRRQAVAWRIRKSLMRNPVANFEVVTDPSTGLSIRLLHRADGTTTASLQYGIGTNSDGNLEHILKRCA